MTRDEALTLTKGSTLRQVVPTNVPAFDKVGAQCTFDTLYIDGDKMEMKIEELLNAGNTSHLLPVDAFEIVNIKVY